MYWYLEVKLELFYQPASATGYWEPRANRRTNNLSHESYNCNDTLDCGAETSPTSKMLRQEGSLPTHTHTHTHTHTRARTHTHTRTHTQKCTHTHEHTSTQTHTHLHTHLHTYTHTRQHAKEHRVLTERGSMHHSKWFDSGNPVCMGTERGHVQSFLGWPHWALLTHSVK